MTGPPWGVRDLTVRFGRHTALDGVTLEAPARAVTAVCGGDGAGKSTLLRALAGGVRPASGRIRRPERSRIGYVAGTSGLYADLSVDENVAFVAGAYGLSGARLTARTRALLEQIGLEGTGGRLAERLSGGMRQKLAFVLAMLHEPYLLILDEPTTGLDPVSRADLWQLIAGAAAGGAGVVVSTSYLDEAERAASVLVLDAGRAEPSGSRPARNTAAPEGLRREPPDTLTAETTPSPQHTGRLARAGEALAATGGVTRLFGRFAAVEGVHLTIRKGEVVGLLGANGAGKTTLLRLLLGLLRPTMGHVELFGRAPSRATRGRIGYVPQGLGLWEDLTVAENLAFLAHAFGSTPPLLEPDLAAASGTVVRDLPLGLRRRLAFAAALAHAPELLVLDEPTSGVDADARARLWDTIHSTAEEGAGVLVTTHHMEEAGECDRLVVMAAGRVVAEGTLASIIGERVAVAVEADRWESAFSALDGSGLLAALVGRTLRVPSGDATLVRETLAAHGVTADVRVVPATFEETFVALVRAGDRPPESRIEESAVRGSDR